MSIKQRNPQNVKTITDAVVYISYADDPKVSKNGVLDHTWMTEHPRVCGENTY